MNGFNYIISKQLNWARRNNIQLVGSKITKGKKNYTTALNDNLFEPLLKEVQLDISKGDGGELKGSLTQSPKMFALHSSSALGVNIFQYWKKNKKYNEITHALGLSSKDNKSSIEIKFESKFEINPAFQFSPNIDVVINNKPGQQIKAFGIECKFSEAYAYRAHNGLSRKYIDEIDTQWADIPFLYDFAKIISPEDSSYKHLHPAQLIKHILGLKKKYGKRGFRLLYLWYDVIGVEGCNHRKEIDQFAQIVKSDNVHFHYISYQELIVKLAETYRPGNEKYINYLTDRYL